MAGETMPTAPANPSNIAGEITRILSARNLIRTKFVDLGISNTNDDITALATAASNIENRGNVTATVQEGATYTIPKGYHNGSGTVSGVAGGGNYNLQSKSDITPTKNQINITPDDGYYGLSDVTINPIPNAYQDVSSVTATASDVLATKIFVPSSGSNTTGTMPNNGAVSKTLDATTGNQSYTVPTGYHNGSGTVSITLENQTVTPTTSSQNVTPATGKVLGKVTVNAIPSKFGDTTGDDAVASNILSGKKAHTISNGSAVQITGSMTNRGAVKEILTTSNTEYTVPAGYHNGNGTVWIVTEARIATPSSSSQTISATSGKVISSVTINAIPSPFYDTSAVDAAASDVLVGKTIIDATGAQVSGTMTDNDAVTSTLTTTSTQYTIPTGYHNGSGKVSIVTETKSITPSSAAQTIYATSGKVISAVTVNSIPSPYFDTSSVDAVASNVLSGKKIVSSTGAVVTGTMTNRGAVSQTLTTSSTQYTVPAGYHSGSGTVNIVTETKSATPSTSSQDITPTSGKVLSKVTVAAIPSNYIDSTGVNAPEGAILEGYSAIGIYEDPNAPVLVEGTMPNRGNVSSTLTTTSTQYTIPNGFHDGFGTVSIVTETKSATPAAAQQTIYATSGKVLSAVTVAAIPSPYFDTSGVDAVASNILSGKKIVSATGATVTGTMTNRGAVSQTLSATTTQYTVPAGFHNGSGTVKITLEEKTTTPTTSSQNITPTSGKVLSKVVVNAIPSQYGDVTNDTAVASNILAGVKAHTVSNGSAVQITGTMVNYGSIAQSFDGMTVSSYALSTGYYAGGVVYLDTSIETALASI